MLLRILTCFAALLLAACSGQMPGPDHRGLETPAGEAVLRHVLAQSPHRTEAKQLTIVMGDRMDSATPDFENKFADTGLLVTPSRKLVAGAVNGEVRIFDSTTNQVPLVLQLSSLVPEKDNPANYEAVAAWTWKDQARRFRLRVLTKPDGTFEIRLIEELTVPLRNQDGMPPPRDRNKA